MPNTALPITFTLKDALLAGVQKHRVYTLLEQGEIERVGRGVYMRPGVIDPAFTSLAAATVAQESATLCLTSALVHHDLSDAIPFESTIALPRGTRPPSGIANVKWHSFDSSTFSIGREQITIDNDLSVSVYSSERTIIDCFRLMHIEGNDVAHEALRRWLRRRGNTPSALLKTASSFPKALPKLRIALDVLL